MQTFNEDIENIKDSCAYDVCMSPDPDEAICDIISSYVRQCQLLLHVDIPAWRNTTFCRMYYLLLISY